MLSYIIQRIIRLIPLLFLISVVVFVIIQLPPGDYLTEHINRLRASGNAVDQDEIERLKRLYALDRPMYMQYLKWISNILLYGDLGVSFQWNKPVNEVIAERMALTIAISVTTTFFVWGVAIPIGIYSAVRQYTFFDYFFTFLGFIGLAVPGFLLAMVIMYIAFAYFGVNVGGLFSPEYEIAPWSINKVIDMLQHIWVPVLVLGISGTAWLIRVMRGTMLDELGKQYVMTARAKGLSEFRLIMKYPVRIAINPLISTIGWLLPWFFSGGTLIDIVLNLPTAGPVLWRALMSQDMFLAGSFVLITSALTVIGTLLSDVLLAVVDPRIRFGKVGEA
jgi:peptide/nickel transport system permease protein